MAQHRNHQTLVERHGQPHVDIGKERDALVDHLRVDDRVLAQGPGRGPHDVVGVTGDYGRRGVRRVGCRSGPAGVAIGHDGVHVDVDHQRELCGLLEPLLHAGSDGAPHPGEGTIAHVATCVAAASGDETVAASDEAAADEAAADGALGDPGAGCARSARTCRTNRATELVGDAPVTGVGGDLGQVDAEEVGELTRRHGRRRCGTGRSSRCERSGHRRPARCPPARAAASTSRATTRPPGPEPTTASTSTPAPGRPAKRWATRMCARPPQWRLPPESAQVIEPARSKPSQPQMRSTRPRRPHPVRGASRSWWCTGTTCPTGPSGASGRPRRSRSRSRSCRSPPAARRFPPRPRRRRATSQRTMVPSSIVRPSLGI